MIICPIIEAGIYAFTEPTVQSRVLYQMTDTNFMFLFYFIVQLYQVERVESAHRELR